MTELRNVEADLARFRTRVFVVSMVVLACFALLVMRLMYLQIWRHDDLRAQAENNRTSVVPIVPNRGLILDRNGIVLASNYSAYTLEITPSKSDGVEQTIVQGAGHHGAGSAAFQKADGRIQKLRVSPHSHPPDRY